MQSELYIESSVELCSMIALACRARATLACCAACTRYARADSVRYAVQVHGAEFNNSIKWPP